MGVQISGDNVTVPGQILVALAPTAATHAARKSDLGGHRALIRDVDLNTGAPADIGSVAMPAKWMVKRVTVFNSTANLSSAIIDIRSAAGGAGVGIVAAETLSGLTAAGKGHVCTVDAPAELGTALLLYARITTAAGVAGTADILIEYDDLVDV